MSPELINAVEANKSYRYPGLDRKVSRRSREGWSVNLIARRSRRGKRREVRENSRGDVMDGISKISVESGLKGDGGRRGFEDEQSKSRRR